VLKERLLFLLPTDTSDLEAQIDQLVYQLYELTPEEISIVEESVK
jgi:adenine-specific DNA-methyltransferase